MSDHASNPPRSWGVHLGRRRATLHEPQEVGGGEPAEQRALAAGADGRKVRGRDARRSVAHPVHAGVLPQQGATTDALLDLGAADPSGQHLPARDDAVRFRRELADDRIYGSALGSHFDP